MTPEIMKRIDQIRNGEIPEGYKKGKIGIVPEEWEEVPFSTLFTSTSDYTDDLEKYPLYSLTIEDGITAKTERYDRSHLVKKENSYKIVCPNDYAYNPMNLRFGAVARHRGSFPVAVSGYYDIFTTVHKSDLPFMDSFLTSGFMITYYNRMSTGSLVEKQRVHFSDFLKFSLPLPPIEERKRIADILTTQDAIIECCEKKINQLKQMKKYYLQNIFPKHGETVPKIRFKGFNGPWEQCRLGEMVVFSKGTGYSKGDLKKIGTPIILYGRLYTDYEPVIEKVDTFVDMKPGSVFSNGGEIIIPASGESAEEISIASVVKESGIILGGDINIITPPVNLDSVFLAISLSEGKPHYDLAKMAQGKSVVHLHNNDLEKIELIYPSYAEQVQISTFIMSIDKLITLHKKKLKEEQKKKVALQQQLFMGIVRIKNERI